MGPDTGQCVNTEGTAGDTTDKASTLQEFFFVEGEKTRAV